ncbi:MAG: hypothetical protein FWD03_00145 [Defluviitaleaceae bacterium]|nr:hypothetical protein [Defluviitaleaceae bacterium]
MNQYIRIVMPLASETKGYEHKGKTPSGRCLLESRAGTGKLMLWVQDLKHEALYRVHLIFKSDNTYAGLPLCALSVPPTGKAELRCTFDPANIEGYGFPLDQCLAVAIISGEGRAASAPLCGYQEGPIPWRNGFMILEKNKKELPKEAPAIPKAEPPKAPAITIEVPEVPVPEEIAPEEIIPEALTPEAIVESPPTTPPTPTSTLSDTFKQEVDAILKTHTKMQPFQKQNRDVEWVRISPDEELSLPEDVRSLLNDPFVKNAFSQYSHLLLGKTTDDGNLRYYIGVPALYNPEDKAIGFKQFKGSKDADPVDGDYGYWLVHIS